MLDKELTQATVAERRAVADWLAGPDEASLRTPSPWEVRTVGAHLAAAVTGGMLPFLGQAVRHRGLHRANDAAARKFAERPIAETAGALRTNAQHRLTNPASVPPVPSPMSWCMSGTCGVRLGCCAGVRTSFGMSPLARRHRFSEHPWYQSDEQSLGGRE